MQNNNFLKSYYALLFHFQLQTSPALSFPRCVSDELLWDELLLLALSSDRWYRSNGSIKKCAFDKSTADDYAPCILVKLEYVAATFKHISILL